MQYRVNAVNNSVTPSDMLLLVTTAPPPQKPAMNDTATTLERLVAKADQLYSLPAVATEVLQLTKNPQIDVRALKDCIENDPALTGKLLRVVNSSLFGLSREVSDLNQALALLGSKPLKLLVLGFSLPPGLFTGVEAETLARYWRHTLTRAVAAREISEVLFEVPGDDAFIAGLLHDLGMLLLIQELREPYVRLLDRVYAGGQDLAALETESMGFDHTTLSARLLAQWGLPESIVDAVAHGTVPGPTDAPPPESPLLQTLHLAELLARLLADEQPGVLDQLLETGRRYRNFSREQLKTLVDSLQEKVHQLADILSLQLPEGTDYRDVLIEAHEQLAEVAADAAKDLLRNRSQSVAGMEEDTLLAEIGNLAAALADAFDKPVKPAGGAEAPAAEHVAAATPAATATRQIPAAVTQADPGLLGRLATVVAACRQSRRPLSLLVAQLVDADQLVIDRGPDGFGQLRRLLESACRDVDHACTMCVPHGEAGFAIVMPDCERRQAIELGNQLIEAVRRDSVLLPGPELASVGIGVGVAALSLPPKSFPPDELVAAAERCLYGSRASGGGVVKSIEIY